MVKLYFLKQLKRAGVPPHQLLYFYSTVIRPVLKYASPVWHYSITRAQPYQLKSIQQESPADAVKPARRKSMPKLLQFDVFRFISPNSISPTCQCI